jgi:glyoxylase-like metal-dependent hydrolase (beta-lactamase superfamily II)
MVDAAWATKVHYAQVECAASVRVMREVLAALKEEAVRNDHPRRCEHGLPPAFIVTDDDNLQDRGELYAGTLSRRRFLVAAGTAWAGTWLARGNLFAAAYPAAAEPGIVQRIRNAARTEPIGVQRLRGNLSVLSGSGGNVAVLPGRDGTLLIDSGIVGAKVAASVATVTREPVRHLINTHWHFDHTDANEWHHAHGAAIVAQENTRKWLSADTRVKDWDFTFPRSVPGAIPASVFSDHQDVTLNGSLIRLQHYPPAHTDSDISVHFTNADVLHVADTWWNGMYPFIDYSTGGSIDGMIRATRANLATTSANTVIVPGHGDVGDRAALAKWQDMLVATRDRVATLKKQGRTVKETVAAKPTAAFDAAYGRQIIGPEFFTRLVYEGV